MAKRPIQPMPEDVLTLLEQRGLLGRYQERPHYQRNDYLGWIGRAVRPATRQKRINQMLEELDAGGTYMGMDHPPSRRT